MSIQKELETRSGGVCELCGATQDLEPFEVQPSDGSSDQSIYVCQTCVGQMETLDANYWRCLDGAMWSGVGAVQVTAYRLLKKLGQMDMAEQIYMDDETMKWANALADTTSDAPVRDSNGNILAAGDSVTIIKDLEVKGAGFTAKQGTVVKNISLNGNPEQIEGRVNGVKIVLLSKFLKKVIK